jgi:hypothetical protein
MPKDILSIEISFHSWTTSSGIMLTATARFGHNILNATHITFEKNYFDKRKMEKKKVDSHSRTGIKKPNKALDILHKRCSK